MIKRTCPIPLLLTLTALLAGVASGAAVFTALADNAQAATVTGGTQPPPNTPITPKAGAGKILTTPTKSAPLQPYYNAPTENLTKVANAISLHTYSLTTQVIFSAGLALTKPVCITVFYDSYSGRAYSNALFQAYDGTNGNRLVFNDQEGIGTPRQANLRIQLFEPGTGPCGPRVVGTGFDIPDTLRVNLDPLYYVAVRPMQVTRLEDCPMLTSADVGVRWFSPDDQLHETSFRFGMNQTVTVPGSEWSAQEVSASRNYHMPNVGLYGFRIPSAPSIVNLIPAPLAAGTPRAVQEVTLQMEEPVRHCKARVQYIIDRQLRRSPPRPTANVAPLTGGAFEQPK